MRTLRSTFNYFRIRIINILHHFYSNDTPGVSSLNKSVRQSMEPAVTDVYFLAFARVVEQHRKCLV
jgi:hypothetical protein